MAKYQSGIYVDIEPVYVSSLSARDLVEKIQILKYKEIIVLPDPKTWEEFLTSWKDPILSATKARNWKQLAKTGASYSISWSDNAVSKLDKKGRWEYDPQKMRILPPDTTIEQIVEIILEDVHSRPELFK